MRADTEVRPYRILRHNAPPPEWTAASCGRLPAFQRPRTLHDPDVRGLILLRHIHLRPPVSGHTAA